MYKIMLRILLLALLLISLAFVVPSSTPVAIGECPVTAVSRAAAKAVPPHA